MNTKAKKRSVKQKTTVAWRYYLVLGVILLVYGALTARAAYIQVIEPDMLKEQGKKRSLRTALDRVHRGSILDRNGRELAVSVPVETVWADPKTIAEHDALSMVEHWQALADVLDKDVDAIKARVSKNPNKRFVYVERQVSPAMANYIKQLKIPGIHLRKESKRFYPAGEISSHVVGFNDVDDNGIEGVERMFNKALTGVNGTTDYLKDARGNRVEILGSTKAEPSQDITLSIDQRIQALAYRELKGAVKAFKATSGSVVVTNVHTGEILALVNSPSFNPNNRKGVAVHRFRNRAITDIFEPGSTMKPLTMLTALEFGNAVEGDEINTSPGWMRLGGRRVSDPVNRGTLSLDEILMYSSNMGTAKLALGMPKEFLLDRFFDVGFGEDTGTNLVGESAGMMHDRPRWSKFELATLSFGYALAITPLQIARFYSTIANGGIKRPLSIIKRDTIPEGERIFSQKNTALVRDMLEGVVEKKARKAYIEGYRVGGKTGTSRKSIVGGYGNDYVGLFAGIAPLTDPQLTVVVVINEPGGDVYHGGEIAAPVFARVMKGALRLLNIAPDKITTARKAETKGEGDA